MEGKRVTRKTSSKRTRKTSPKRTRRTSPRRTSPRRTSPKRTRRTSPKRTRRTSPKRVRRTSPKRTRRTSPKRTRRTSPKRTRRTSPRRKIRSRRLNPGFMSRFFGEEARQLEGGTRQTGFSELTGLELARALEYDNDIRQRQIQKALADYTLGMEASGKKSEEKKLRRIYNRIYVEAMDRRNPQRKNLPDLIREKPRYDRENFINERLDKLYTILTREESLQSRLSDYNYVTSDELRSIIKDLLEEKKLRLLSLYG